MSNKVLVQPSGLSFLVEDNESILDAALRQDIALPYGCRDGACGSCENKLISGEVYYPTGELPKALSEEQHQLCLTLFCQARAKTNLVIEAREVSAIKGITVKTLPCRVLKMEKYAEDVMVLFLKFPQTQDFIFLAGQYIDILLRDGRHRSYSIANPPHQNDSIELHIRHVPQGTFSNFVFTNLKGKAILRVKGPLGTFFLREDSNRSLIMIAGGTGFAPIKGIIEHALAIGIEQDIHFYWGVRAQSDLYFPDLPLQWSKKYPNFHFTPVLSQPKSKDKWQGRTGYVTEAIAADFPDLGDFDVYAAGPPIMIESAKELLRPNGLVEDHYYYDSFEYAVD